MWWLYSCTAKRRLSDTYLCDVLMYCSSLWTMFPLTWNSSFRSFEFYANTAHTFRFFFIQWKRIFWQKTLLRIFSTWIFITISKRNKKHAQNSQYTKEITVFLACTPLKCTNGTRFTNHSSKISSSISVNRNIFLNLPAEKKIAKVPIITNKSRLITACLT